MLLLGLKEFFRRIYTNIFTALQLSVVFLILLSIVSSVQSRTELYMPVKDYLKGDGVYTMSSAISLDVNNIIINEDDLIKKHPEIDSVFTSYTPDVFYPDSDGKFISYNDEMLNMYSPKLKSGRWFKSSDNSENTIYGVTSAGSGLEVDDTVSVTNVTYDQKTDPTFTHPIEKRFKVKIIGVLDESTQVLGADTYITDRDDFRNLYGDYDESSMPLLLLSQSQLSKNGVGYTINGNKQIIKYKSGLSDQKISELNMAFNSVGFIPLRKFSSVSKLYVYEQIIKLLPLLVCIALLVIVSTVSISALNVKGGLKTYSIFYVCGSDRAQCLGVCLINSILTASLAAVVSIIFMNVGILSGLLGSTVIKASGLGILACAIAFILQVICSMVMPITLMSKGTLKDNLSANE